MVEASSSSCLPPPILVKVRVVKGVQMGTNYDRDRKSRDQQINSKMDDFVDVHENTTQIWRGEHE